MALKAGDWVEVRSREEILRSLDANGRLDGLPLMPQMLRYCGQRFKVYKRAHKTCDTVNGTGGRRLADGIHLYLRCDGEAYGGCQAACLIFWKEAWLKPIGGEILADRLSPSVSATGCTEDAMWSATRAESPPGSGPRYTCQATELPSYTTRLRWWDLRQYLQDYTSGNASLAQLLQGFIYACYYSLSADRRRNRIWGPFLRRLYDRLQALWGGVPFPRRMGTLTSPDAVPNAALDLQPGELVRVKPYEDILATIDLKNRNRGLFFDAEMVPYCGKTFRVKSRLSHFINEKTGRMQSLKTPAVILENAWCQSRYSNCRLHCPRSIYSWWREVWLERVPETGRTGVWEPQPTCPSEERPTPAAARTVDIGHLPA